MMEAAGDTREQYGRLGEDDVEAGRYQQTAATGSVEASGTKSSSSSEDGSAKWILCGLLAWLYLWGNWSNIEPVVMCKPPSNPNSSTECIHDTAWLPQSYYFSFYFLLANGFFTMIYYAALPPLLLLIFTTISILQDWIFFGVYFPAANDLASIQSSHAKGLIHFSQGAAVLTHLSKYGLLVIAYILFNRRGGTLNLSGLRRTYQQMTSGVPPAY